jgi:hypothetical protein
MSVPVSGTISRTFDFGDAVWEAIRKAAINVWPTARQLGGQDVLYEGRQDRQHLDLAGVSEAGGRPCAGASTSTPSDWRPS